MRAPGRADALIELLDLVRAEWHPKGAPADRVVASFFRSRRYIGGGDRRWISDALYGLLRDWRSFLFRAQSVGLGSDSRSILIVWLCGAGDDIQHYFDPGQRYGPAPLSPAEETSISALMQRLPGDTSSNATSQEASEAPEAPETPEIPEIARSANIPEPLISLFKDRFGPSGDQHWQALKHPASLDIRMNPLKGAKTPPSDVGEWQALPLSPTGFRAHGLPRLTGHQRYLTGDFEIQDEASQICAHLIAASPGMTVVDYCAGTGGKTLAIAGAIKNDGTIIAMDIHKKRLSKLDARAERAGASCIRTRLLPGKSKGRLRACEDLIGKADRVLVDAPCSGSGTWRRNPAQRWHYGARDIKNFHDQQVEILSEASRLVKPGGRLIYATCSLFSIENEQSIKLFQNMNKDFEIIDFKEIWDDIKLPNLPHDTLSHDPRFLQLAPSHHGTDGFFIAMMQRV